MDLKILKSKWIVFLISLLPSDIAILIVKETISFTIKLAFVLHCEDVKQMLERFQNECLKVFFFSNIGKILLILGVIISLVYEVFFLGFVKRTVR